MGKQPEWVARFGEPVHVTSPVNGVDTEFYPISVDMMFSLRATIGAVSRLIATLTEGKNDVGNIVRDVGSPYEIDGKLAKEPNGTILRDREAIVDAISPDLAALRHKHRSDALQELIDSLSSQEGLERLARIVMNSLKLPKPVPPASEFLEQVPLPHFVDMLIGTAKANKGVFGPLERLLGPYLDGAQERIKAKLAEHGQTPTSNQTSSGETSPTA